MILVFLFPFGIVTKYIGVEVVLVGSLFKKHQIWFLWFYYYYFFLDLVYDLVEENHVFLLF